MIVAVAIVILPAVIPGEVGTFKVIVNISSPSTMLSLITVIFIVLLLAPAVIVAVCVAELKSTPPPNKYNEAYDYYIFKLYAHIHNTSNTVLTCAHSTVLTCVHAAADLIIFNNFLSPHMVDYITIKYYSYESVQTLLSH